MSDTQTAHYDPWRNLHRLPATAPIHAFRPDDYPKPAAVADRLRQEGIDPESAGAIITAIGRRNWMFRLIGVPVAEAQMRFVAEIIEPRHLVPWAHTPLQPTPAAALGQVYAVCLDDPPWGGEDQQ